MIDQVFGVMSSRSLRELAEEVALAQNASKEAQREYSSAQKRREHLIEALRLDRLIAQVNEELPGLQEREELLKARRALLERQLRELAEETAEVRANTGRERQTISELNRAENLYERRQNRFSQRDQEVKVALRGLRLDSELHPVAVSHEQSEVRRMLSEISRRRQIEDKAGLVIQVSEELSRPIARALQQGLDTQPIAFLENSEVTISQLDTGIDVQRIRLRDELSTDARSLQAEEEALKARSTWLRRLTDAMRLREKAIADLEDTRRVIGTLLESLQGATKDRYTDLVRQRESVLQDFSGTASELAEVHEHIDRLTGSGTPEQLREALRLHLVGEPVDLGLDLLIADAQDLLEEAKAAVDSTLESMRGATQTLANARDQVALGTARAADPEFAWLSIAGIEIPDSRQSVEEQADVLHQLASQAESLRSELTALENAGEEIVQEVHDLARSLSNQEAHTSNERNRYGSAVVDYFQRRFTDELRNEVIVDALFDRGLNINLILRDLSVSWDTPSGERRIRPLEAFSSGEHAFAYTRVKLETLRTQRAINSAVFLDEFGAYIASDRLEQLTDYVQRHALGTIADQIVIILPRTSAEPADDAFVMSNYFAERPNLEKLAR
jgi:chromosome segregation ATPase